MKPKSHLPILFILFILTLGLLTPRAYAAPAGDGGGFPTSTPTPITPTATFIPTFTPTPTFTPAPQLVIAVTVELPGGEQPVQGEQPQSNVIEQPQETPQVGPNNPIIVVAYIALVIFLIVGAWMLFSMRGKRPGP
jgi:hypothetical protein